MRKGFSKYSFMLDEEREYILKMIEKGHTDIEISRKVGWPIEEVRDTRCEFFPTAGLAKYYLKSQALNLARRVVAEANVEEIVDILSRPNIAVLAPAVKNQPGPMKLGVMTSINPADLGGVRVVAQIGEDRAETQAELVPVPPCDDQIEPDLPHSARSRHAPLLQAHFPHHETAPATDAASAPATDTGTRGSPPPSKGASPCPSPLRNAKAASKLSPRARSRSTPRTSLGTRKRPARPTPK